MRISTALTALAALAQTASTAALPAPKLTQLYKSPNGTWLENLAVRHDGSILTTLLFNSTIAQFSPPHFNAPKIVAQIPGLSGCLGITELSRDVFAVIAGDVSENSMTPVNFSLWTVTFAGNATETTKLVDMPDLKFGNGLTYIPGYALVGDYVGGQIFRVNLTTHQVDVAIKSPLFLAPNGTFGGLNGLRASPDFKDLYFTNMAAGFFGKVPITGDATAAGPITNITGLGLCDDFTVACDGSAFVAGNTQNELFHVSADGKATVVAGRNGTDTLESPTSAHFGRGEFADTLFITTAGSPLGHPAALGGQFLSLKPEFMPRCHKGYNSTMV